jgi:hypothetical protein
MMAGPVQYKRKYELWILILLIILFWPAAIIYYFMCPKVPVLEYGAYPMAMAPGPAWPSACPRCGRPLTWVAQYGRWYCPTEQLYL